MSDIQKKIEIVKPHMSLQSLHDFVYGNILIETLAYGEDHKMEHMSELYSWQQALAEIIKELNQPEAKKTTKSEKPESK